MELLIVTGDLPSDHATTLRVEGACGQLHYLVLSSLPFSTLPLHCSLHSCSLHCCLHSALSFFHFSPMPLFLSCLLSSLTFLLSSFFFLISYFFFLLSSFLFLISSFLFLLSYFLLLTPCMFRTPPSSLNVNRRCHGRFLCI
jgi:hypothetical protein